MHQGYLENARISFAETYLGIGLGWGFDVKNSQQFGTPDHFGKLSEWIGYWKSDSCVNDFDNGGCI